MPRGYKKFKQTFHFANLVAILKTKPQIQIAENKTSTLLRHDVQADFLQLRIKNPNQILTVPSLAGVNEYSQKTKFCGVKFDSGHIETKKF